MDFIGGRKWEWPWGRMEFPYGMIRIVWIPRLFFSTEFGYKLCLSEKSSFCHFWCIPFAQSYNFFPVADFGCYLLPGSKMSENGLKIMEDHLTAEKEKGLIPSSVLHNTSKMQLLILSESKTFLAIIKKIFQEFQMGTCSLMNWLVLTDLLDMW